MHKHATTRAALIAGMVMLLAAGASAQMMAEIPGITGPAFNLTATDGYISTPDPGRLYFWGYANGGGTVQYPGPTLIVDQGDTVTVTLTNNLDVPTSIIFPGQTGVTAVGDAQGVITAEAAAGGGTATYSFVAANAGTYLYHSGTNVQLQVEMGLLGAIIVRPAAPMQAYEDADTAYDREVLFLESEMDPIIHELVETGRIDQVDNTEWFPAYWFLNGRCAPDTMLNMAVPILPNQPYNCMPMIAPGERLLMRVINAGRDYHPFHTHGNHHYIVARDGRVLSTGGGVPDLTEPRFTTTVSPGGTMDAIFYWTGEQLGWDIYGHQSDVDNPPLGWEGGGARGDEDIDHNNNGIFDPLPDPEPDEYLPDHGKPFPVTLPDNKELTFGAMWSGSPFLGAAGSLPPGEGGFNPLSGFVYMWHSHKEKEMHTNNVFPGGMMTMLIVIPPIE